MAGCQPAPRWRRTWKGMAYIDVGDCPRDLPGATYFVTTCLARSIPAEGLLDLARYRARLMQFHQAQGMPDAGQVSKLDETGQVGNLPHNDLSHGSDWQLRCWKKVFARCDDWLDRRPAVRHFADPALAAIVADACYFWAGRRYDLLAYTVMPSHLHWVFRPIQEPEKQVDNLLGQGQVGNLPHVRSPRERIMHTLKLHTARECNRHLAKCGPFRQDESYDHCVRDDDELERIIQYVELNPVKAGLAVRPEQWQFSSAFERIHRGLMLGEPIVPSV